MRSSMNSAAAAAIMAMTSLFPSAAHAFFRLPCNHPVTNARVDPIVNPGAISPHEHTVMGGNAFNASMTYADTQTSTCSTCKVRQDLSNYWTPTLWYVHPEEKAGEGVRYEPVDHVGGVLVYYLQRQDKKDPKYEDGLIAFPEGFQMVAGDPTLRTYDDSSLAQRAVHFTCLGVSGPATPEIPAHNCPNGLRAEVVFPSCWDGVNLDSPDHKSHMAYPSNMDSGFCPESHPHRFVTLFYEVMFSVSPFAGSAWWDGPNGDGHPFALSNGDTTGYSWHADFLNGWDGDVLQRAINECTSDSGVIEECKVLDFFDDNSMKTCRLPQIVDDPPRNRMASHMPGCISATGPDGKYASGAAPPVCVNTAQLLSEPIFPFTDMAADGWSYRGCAPGAGKRPIGQSKIADDNMTVPRCMDHCAKGGFAYAGVEYGRECFCGNADASQRLADVAAVDTGLIGGCEMPCSGDPDQFCGGAGQLGLYEACSGNSYYADGCKNVQMHVP